MTVAREKAVSKEILELSKRIELPEKISTCCLYGSRISGYARDDSDFDVLMVLDEYSEGVRYHYQDLFNVHAAFLIVDKKLFELDVIKGGLGEFIAGRILTPYIPLSGSEYISNKEHILKKRIILEESEDIILTYEELARGLVIRPEFFILSRINKRMKAYPPLKYSYYHLFGDTLRENSFKSILPGFERALDELRREGILKRKGGYVIFNDHFIDEIISKKHLTRVVNVIESSQRALHSYLTHGRAGRVSVEILAKELTSKVARGLSLDPKRSIFIDSRQYLFLETSSGKVNLNEKRTVNDIIKKVYPNGTPTILPLGNALNEVFLVETKDRKYIVKKYSDWYGFKWFLLNLAALGSKSFSVSGKARLTNEYSMVHHFKEKGIETHRIIDINLGEKAVVKEFINGQLILDIVKESIGRSEGSPRGRDISEKVGRFIATVHSKEITFGDSKPENFIITPNDKIIFLDLEQSRKGGDFAWDIAEFLYYTGHYGFTLHRGLKDLIEGFIEGYTSTGCSKVLKKAASLNYFRVFSFWTPAQIIYSISSHLRSVGARA